MQIDWCSADALYTLIGDPNVFPLFFDDMSVALSVAHTVQYTYSKLKRAGWLRGKYGKVAVHVLYSTDDAYLTLSLYPYSTTLRTMPSLSLFLVRGPSAAYFYYTMHTCPRVYCTKGTVLWDLLGASCSTGTRGSLLWMIFLHFLLAVLETVNVSNSRNLFTYGQPLWFRADMGTRTQRTTSRKFLCLGNVPSNRKEKSNCAAPPPSYVLYAVRYRTAALQEGGLGTAQYIGAKALFWAHTSLGTVQYSTPRFCLCRVNQSLLYCRISHIQHTF